MNQKHVSIREANAWLQTHIFSEVSCHDRRHDPWNGPECVGDSQKESCIPAGGGERSAEGSKGHRSLMLPGLIGELHGGRHPPRSDVDLVHEDSGGAEPSCGGGEREEGDGEDVVAAGVNHSHEESRRQQQTCREDSS